MAERRKNGTIKSSATMISVCVSVCVYNYSNSSLCIYCRMVFLLLFGAAHWHYIGNCFAGVQRTTVQCSKRSIRNVNIDTLSCIPNERLQRQCLPKMLQLYLRFLPRAGALTPSMFSAAPLFIIAWLNRAGLHFQSHAIPFCLQPA